MKYFSLYIPAGTPEGYSYVRDYKGNLIYFGTKEECEIFISRMEVYIDGE